MREAGSVLWSFEVKGVVKRVSTLIFNRLRQPTGTLKKLQSRESFRHLLLSNMGLVSAVYIQHPLPKNCSTTTVITAN